MYACPIAWIHVEMEITTVQVAVLILEHMEIDFIYLFFVIMILIVCLFIKKLFQKYFDYL